MIWKNSNAFNKLEVMNWNLVSDASKFPERLNQWEVAIQRCQRMSRQAIDSTTKYQRLRNMLPSSCRPEADQRPSRPNSAIKLTKWAIQEKNKKNIRLKDEDRARKGKGAMAPVKEQAEDEEVLLHPRGPRRHRAPPA